MASFVRFGLLVLLFAGVAKTAPQDPVSVRRAYNDKLDQISQRVYALEQSLATKLKTIDSMLRTILNSESQNVLIIENQSVSDKDTDVSRQENQSVSEKDTDVSRQDVVKAINDGNFALAEAAAASKAATLTEIVRDMYQDSESNTEAILNFTKNLSDTSLKYEILTSLCEQSKQSNQTDIIKMIALARTFSESIGDAEPVPAAFESLLNDVINSTISRLSTIMASDPVYIYDDEVRLLSKSIIGLRNVPKDVMNGLVNEVYDTIKHGTINYNLMYHDTQYKNLYGYETLIDKLNAENNFETAVALDVISSLLHSKSNDSQRLLNKFPKCLTNMLSIKPFCIWNRLKDVYLTLTDYETVLLRAILGCPRLEVDESIGNNIRWVVNSDSHFNPHSLFFQNHGQKDLYIISGEPSNQYSYHYYKPFNVHAYEIQWEPRKITNGPAERGYKGFFIESQGDSCYIKTDDNEYLVASDEYLSKSGYKNVMRNNNEKSASSLWEITECP